MKVLHINYHSSSGGATRSMLRLHRGLLESGADSRLLVRESESVDPRVHKFEAVIPEKARLNEQLFGYFLQHKGVDVGRTELSNTVFTIPFPGFDLTGHPCVREADILNLHWPAYLLSAVTLGSLLDLGKPVFWTIHDQWAYTGGCHYAAGCEGYLNGCSPCPQLAGELARLPGAIHRERRRQLSRRTIHIVGPSRWIVAGAGRSSLLRNQPIHHVPYGIETDIFAPVDQATARASLGLPPDAFILLFGADHLAEKRKGWHHLHAALEFVVGELAGKRPIHLAFFGNTPEDLSALPVPLHELGYIRDDARLCLAYNAADLFLLPSLEDNQPNTVLEAMACGTPVAGFEVGALPDMITDSGNGYLAPTGDARALGEAIMRCATTPHAQMAIRAAARRTIEDHYPLHLQAERYLELYRDALSSTAQSARRMVGRTSVACPMSAAVGGMLKDHDVLRPLGQLLKSEGTRAKPFKPGWSFGIGKERRRVQHYLKSWLESLPPGRRYYLTDDHGVYSHAEISLRAGFRNPEGPYPGMNLPFPLIWSLAPEGEFLILKSVGKRAQLRLAVQTPIHGLEVALDGPTGCLWTATLGANLSNPDRSRHEFSIRLPPLQAASTLRLTYRLPGSVDQPDDLAMALFKLEIEPS